jgi:hypothetical protein
MVQGTDDGLSPDGSLSPNDRVSPNDGVSANDKEAIQHAERLIAAMQNLRVILEQREETLQRAIGRRVSTEFSVALKEAQITENRDVLNEALFELERCRRASRVASFRSALDHGITISELSRIWGFSRQMASRYAKEARED